jgi:hypothetical protein
VRFDLGTWDIAWYEGEDGNDADAVADVKQEVLKGHDGSVQNVED